MAMASALLGSCEDASIVDPREAATLVIAGEIEFDDLQQQALANAAESWNIEFGTRLSFDPEDDDAPQRIEIGFSKDACVNDLGQRTHARATPLPPKIALCSETAGTDLYLTYESVRHELGHILGIPAHVKDNTTAVMTGVATDPFHWFQVEDRRLFRAANPEWHGETGCAVSPWIAYGQPSLAQPTGHPIQLVWAQPNAIHFSAIDAETADIGGISGDIATNATPEDVQAHPSVDGFLVTWFEGNRINLTSVALPDATIGETNTVDLEWPAESFYEVSAVHAAPYYWLALTVRTGATNTSRTLHVLKLEDSTGAILARLEVPNAHGQIVSHDDEIFLVTGELSLANAQNVVRLHRLVDADPLALGESIELVSVAISLAGDWALPEPILAVQSSRMGVLALLEVEQDSGSIQLVRASTEGTLAIDQTVALPTGAVTEPRLIEAGDHLFIAGSMTQPDHYSPEVYVAQLAVETLEVTRPWRRLSAPDGLAGTKPRLAVDGSQLITVWDEAEEEIRSRCITIE
jgi:hypothetical protein